MPRSNRTTSNPAGHSAEPVEKEMGRPEVSATKGTIDTSDAYRDEVTEENKERRLISHDACQDKTWVTEYSREALEEAARNGVVVKNNLII